MASFNIPAKPSRMMVARCARHLPIVRDLLNSSNSFCCRSLIRIFAAVPAMSQSPQDRETGQDTIFPTSVKGRFHHVTLAPFGFFQVSQMSAMLRLMKKPWNTRGGSQSLVQKAFTSLEMPVFDRNATTAVPGLVFGFDFPRGSFICS